MTWPDGLSPRLRPGGRQLLAAAEFHHVAVDEAHLGVSIHDVSGPAQGARRQPVVRGDQHAVVSVRPVEQAFVERGDVAPVDGMDDHLDPVVSRRQLMRDLRAVVL